MPRAIVRPAEVRICDDRGQGCFTPWVVVPANRTTDLSTVGGTTGELLRHRHWNDEHALGPIFRTALRGSCMRATRHRKVVLDLGAGIGLYSLYFGKKGCECHAVEPLAVNALAIESAAFRNRIQDLKVYRMAMTRVAGIGPLRFSVHDTTGATHTMAQPGSDLVRRVPQRGDWRQTQVLKVAVDPFVQRNRIGAAPRAGVPLGSIDVLKVDVGGAELDVLHSASATLRHVAWLLMTIDPSTMQRNDIARLKELLRTHGFHAVHAQGIPKWDWRQLSGRHAQAVEVALFRNNVTADQMMR